MQNKLDARIFNEYVGERQNADCLEKTGKVLSFFAHTAYGKTVHLKKRSLVDFKSANCAVRILSALVAIALMPIIFVGLLLTYLSLSQKNAHEIALKHFRHLEDQFNDSKKFIQASALRKKDKTPNHVESVPVKLNVHNLELKKIPEIKSEEVPALNHFEEEFNEIGEVVIELPNLSTKDLPHLVEPTVEQIGLIQIDETPENPRLLIEAEEEVLSTIKNEDPVQPLKEEIIAPDRKKDNNDQLVQVGERLAAGLKSFLDKRKAKLVALSLNGLLLENDLYLRSDKEAVLIAVKQNGLALQFASIECRSDIKIVFYAVQNNGLALRYAYDTLKDNPGIVATAIRNNRITYIHASRRLKMDETIKSIKAGIQAPQVDIKPNNLINEFDIKKHLGLKDIQGLLTPLKASLLLAKESKTNKKIALWFIEKSPLNLKHLTDSQRDDEEIVLTAVQINGLALNFASERLKNNVNIVQAAIKQNANAIRYASEELQRNLLPVDNDIYGE